MCCLGLDFSYEPRFSNPLSFMFSRVKADDLDDILCQEGVDFSSVGFFKWLSWGCYSVFYMKLDGEFHVVGFFLYEVDVSLYRVLS